ncbi:MAG: pilus assembly protein TadG-related protein [Nocardioides sp.]
MRLAARLRDRRRDERGAVVVLVAAMTVVLFGIAALVADLGQARVLRGEAQAASDSSALAAANQLYLAGTADADVPAAIAAAHDYARDNYGVTEADWAACQDPGALTYTAPATTYGATSYSATECISYDDDDADTSGIQPQSVRVVAPVKGVKLVFGSVFGASKLEVSAQAEASLKLDSVADCALCVVGFGPHDLQNGDATIEGGSVAINGDVSLKSQGDLTAAGTPSDDGTLSGATISVSGTATGDHFSEPLLQNQEPIDDPLAALPLPTDLANVTPKSNTNPCGAGAGHGPGVYGDVAFSSGCTLQAGLYVITGDWSLTGNDAFTGTGVTLYFTCGTQSSPRACNAPGEEGGALLAHGNGMIKLTAPTTGAYAGLAIAYDRLNTSPLWLTGNGESQYVGTIYGYSAKMRFDGNGCSVTNQSLIVVNSLEFNGNNSCLKSNYVKDKNVFVPPDGLHLSK